MHWHSLTNSENLTKLGCSLFYKLSCLNKHKVLSNWMFKNLPYLCFYIPCWKLKLYTYLLNLCSRKGKSLLAKPKLNLRSHNIPMLLFFHFFRTKIEFEWSAQVMGRSTSIQPLLQVLDIGHYILMRWNQLVYVEYLMCFSCCACVID